MKRSNWVILAGLATIVMLAAVSGVAARYGSAEERTEQAPAWLQEKTSKIVGSYSGSGTRTAEWVLTTVGTYNEVMPDQEGSDEAFADKPVYVVLVDGSFTPPHMIEAGVELTGTQLVLAFDAETQELSVLGIMPKPVNPIALGTVGTMSL